MCVCVIICICVCISISSKILKLPVMVYKFIEEYSRLLSYMLADIALGAQIWQILPFVENLQVSQRIMRGVAPVLYPETYTHMTTHIGIRTSA